MCGMYFTTNHDYIDILSEYNKKRGGINQSMTNLEVGMVGHYQAPTSNLSKSHPSIIDDDFLWHNGILKDVQIHELKNKFDTSSFWDTELLHHYIIDGGDLSDIEGTFALIRYIDNELFICRNALVTLYTNNDFNMLSSAKIPNLCDVLLKSGVWYKYDSVKFVEQDITFTTKNNPYQI